MPKYEIMLIVDPQNVKEAEQIVSEVFGKDVTKSEKLENTQLAYEINGTKTANYVLVEVTTSGANVKEFTRRANISKAIWRNLVVNLESERAIATKDATPKREKYDRPERTERSDRYERTPRPRVEGDNKRPFNKPAGKPASKPKAE